MALSVPVREMASRVFTVAERPRGRRQLESRRTRAAISGKVAAIARASGWGKGDWRGVKNGCWAPGREGGYILTEGAVLLATC